MAQPIPPEAEAKEERREKDPKKEENRVKESKPTPEEAVETYIRNGTVPGGRGNPYNPRREGTIHRWESTLEAEREPNTQDKEESKEEQNEKGSTQSSSQPSIWVIARRLDRFNILETEYREILKREEEERTDYGVGLVQAEERLAALENRATKSEEEWKEEKELRTFIIPRFRRSLQATHDRIKRLKEAKEAKKKKIREEE